MIFRSQNQGIFLIRGKKRICVAHTESYTHIGIDRKLRGHYLIEKRIKLARRTTYALMGTGMHGYNGINPCYYTYVEYVCETKNFIWT